MALVWSAAAKAAAFRLPASLAISLHFSHTVSFRAALRRGIPCAITTSVAHAKGIPRCARNDTSFPCEVRVRTEQGLSS